MMILSLVRNYIPSYQWGFALTSSVRNAFLVRAGLREPKESRDSFACQYYIAIARAMLMM
jgi:hypothetical protein